MPGVGFEPKIPTSDRAAIVTGTKKYTEDKFYVSLYFESLVRNIISSEKYLAT
jgi:hypothetical protein